MGADVDKPEIIYFTEEDAARRGRGRDDARATSFDYDYEYYEYQYELCHARLPIEPSPARWR